MSINITPYKKVINMSLNKKKVEFSGIKDSITKEATIDNGSETSILDKTTALKIGCKPTGKQIKLSSFNNKETSGEIYKCKIKINKTCCGSETEIAVINDCDLLDGPIIGKDYISKTGMTIDESKKNNFNISCECGGIVDELKKEIKEFKKREKSE